MLSKAESSSSGSVIAPVKKYMCVNPYEGFVCKRNGNHAGAAMPNFRTCYAIILATSNYSLALHYPSRVYSRQLPIELKRWQLLFKEKIEIAQIILNKQYAAWGSSTDNNIVNFQAKLQADLGLEFSVIEIVGSPKEELLIINADTMAINLRSNDLTINPTHYANWPRHPTSRLRYYSCRAQFFTDNHDFPVMIVASQNFLAPIDEKKWPVCISEHVKLLKQEKEDAIQTIGKSLCMASSDETNEYYVWAMAIGLEGGVNRSNNLKHYLYLLLSLLHLVDKTVELKPLERQVESIDSMLTDIPPYVPLTSHGT